MKPEIIYGEAIALNMSAEPPTCRIIRLMAPETLAANALEAARDYVMEGAAE